VCNAGCDTARDVVQPFSKNLFKSQGIDIGQGPSPFGGELHQSRRDPARSLFIIPNNLVVVAAFGRVFFRVVATPVFPSGTCRVPRLRPAGASCRAGNASRVPPISRPGNPSRNFESDPSPAAKVRWSAIHTDAGVTCCCLLQLTPSLPLGNACMHISFSSQPSQAGHASRMSCDTQREARCRRDAGESHSRQCIFTGCFRRQG
jgi:hypothetical protein